MPKRFLGLRLIALKKSCQTRSADKCNSVQEEVTSLALLHLLIEVRVESEQVPLEHGHGDLPNLSHVPHARPRGKKGLLVDVLAGRHVDHNCTLLNPGGVHLVLVARHTQDDDVGFSDRCLNGGVLGWQNQLPPREDVQGVNVHAPDLRAIIRQHGSYWSTNDLRPVHYDRRLPCHSLANRKGGVVDLQVLQRLHHCQRRTRQHALLNAQRVYSPLVLVECPAVEVVQPLGVLEGRDRVAQVVVVRAAVEAGPLSEDRIVDHDAIDLWILVGLLQLVLEVALLNLPKLEAEAVGHHGLPRPLGILLGRRIRVRQEADKFGAHTAHGCDGLADLLSEGCRHLIG
mmetsp:Transcript_11546/g.21863  ORF Transcript_11546/g.21863 Transcript_11546/m.21863 type:complete len:343 (+) Transcript_11546:32-1060(+)